MSGLRLRHGSSKGRPASRLRSSRRNLYVFYASAYPPFNSTLRVDSLILKRSGQACVTVVARSNYEAVSSLCRCVASPVRSLHPTRERDAFPKPQVRRYQRLEAGQTCVPVCVLNRRHHIGLLARTTCSLSEHRQSHGSPLFARSRHS